MLQTPGSMGCSAAGCHYTPPIELNNKASDIRSDSLIGLNYRISVYHTNMYTTPLLDTLLDLIDHDDILYTLIKI